MTLPANPEGSETPLFRGCWRLCLSPPCTVAEIQKLTATLLPGLELVGGGVLGNTEDCFTLEALTVGGWLGPLKRQRWETEQSSNSTDPSVWYQNAQVLWAKGCWKDSLVELTLWESTQEGGIWVPGDLGCKRLWGGPLRKLTINQPEYRPSEELTPWVGQMSQGLDTCHDQELCEKLGMDKE